MNQSNYPNPDATVTIIPKTIKIYSDNPIHDAIDRIINYSESLDNPNIDNNHALDCIREAAKELAELCLDAKLEKMNKLIYKLHEQKLNQS